MPTRFASAVTALVGIGTLACALLTSVATPAFAQGADVKACSGADVNAAIPACTRLLALSIPMQQRGAAYGFRARAYYLKGE
jgi:hypothetical protein